MAKQKHGHAHSRKLTPTYITWVSMKQRCRDQKHQAFGRYGGRGIDVCEQWKKDFGIFLLDMGERPRGKTLDRLDNDLGYYKENCRWATNQEQTENRRKKRLIYKGEPKTIAELSKISKVSYNVIKLRIDKGWSVEEAVETPNWWHRKAEIITHKELSPRERLIKQQRENGETLSSIGYKIGISHERVRQLLARLQE